ncbi:Transcriptional regulator PadR-like family protein [uncultured archaeon]|nr:Transcriptional regulator PadR-like family protein [uncultured archaeon]
MAPGLFDKISSALKEDMSQTTPMKRLISLNTYDCLWVYVLKILSEKPVHAYALRKMIEERFGFEPGMVSAYKVLYLLLQEGYVKSRESGRVTNYEITSQGKKIIEAARKFYESQAKILKK